MAGLSYMIRSLQFVCVTVLSALVLHGQNAITCPAANAGHPFDRASIFNGKQGGQEYELAPDDGKKVRARVTQSWFLKDYRTMNIFVRCRYQGTEMVISKDIPANIQTCTFAFDISPKGDITGGRSFACR
jgi:hypothetical protein